MASADLLLHPVRLRIVKAFLGNRTLTTTQLADELGDVPIGSLYRHVARLLDAHVLHVDAERRVRGAVERTYTLRAPATQIQPDEVARMSRDDHRQAFLAYVAGMLDDFDRYVESESFDPVRDGATYRLAAMWLTDTEFTQFVRQIVAVAQPYVENQPTRRRGRRLFYQVLLPATAHTAR